MTNHDHHDHEADRIETLEAVAHQALACLAADHRTLGTGCLSPDRLIEDAWRAACTLTPGAADLASEAADWTDALRQWAREDGRRQLADAGLR